MRKHLNIIAALGFASCLFIPAFASAKPHHNQVCKLESQEFVYFQLDFSQQLNSLQNDLIKSNIRDTDVLNRMQALVSANENLYNDLGKKASQYDTFEYTKSKVEALQSAAHSYYSIAYYKYYHNMQSHVLNAYKLLQAVDYALENFDKQCAQNKRRGKDWMNQWNSFSHTDISGIRPPREPYNDPNIGARPDGNTVYHPVANQPGVGRPSVAPRPAPIAVRAMNPADFNSFYNSIQNEKFDSNRVSMIQSAVEMGNWFSCDQIVRILKLIQFDRYRIDAAAEMYRATADRNNWFKVYDVFEYSSSREELKQRIQ